MDFYVNASACVQQATDQISVMLTVLFSEGVFLSNLLVRFHIILVNLNFVYHDTQSAMEGA